MNTDKSDLLGQITSLQAEASGIMVKAERLGQEFIDKFCPYKKGMILKIKPEYMREQFGRINSIHFDIHNGLNDFAKIYCTALKKDFSEASRRYNVVIKSKKEILEIVKS